MILDPASMTVSHEGVVWAPPRRQWEMVACMSKQPERVWTREILMQRIDFLSREPRSVDTAVKRVRRAFQDRGWPDPIETRPGLGYVWRGRMEAPAMTAPAAGADEFRFRKTQPDERTTP